MKFYIYEVVSMNVIDVIEADTNSECEAVAGDRGYMGNDEIGATYTPAFGFEGGLNA